MRKSVKRIDRSSVEDPPSPSHTRVSSTTVRFLPVNTIESNRPHIASCYAFVLPRHVRLRSKAPASERASFLTATLNVVSRTTPGPRTITRAQCPSVLSSYMLFDYFRARQGETGNVQKQTTKYGHPPTYFEPIAASKQSEHKRSARCIM